MKVWVVILIAAVVVGCAGGGSDYEFEGRVISQMTLTYRGPQTASPERLKGLMNTKVGGRFSSRVIDDDIRRLYESGKVGDVRILGEEDGDSVALWVEIVTRPPPGQSP